MIICLKIYGLFGFSKKTNGQDNQLECQLGDSGKEIKSSIRHRAWWQPLTWDGCFCLLTGRERWVGAIRRTVKFVWYHDLRMYLLSFWEEGKGVQDSLEQETIRPRHCSEFTFQ